MNIESNNPEEGFDASVDAIAELLEPKAAKPAPEAENDAEEEEPEQSEESESEEAGTEEDEQDEQPEAATLESLEIDGETIQLPANIAAKIKPSLLRQQDYTRKTQEVAEQRKQVQAAQERAQQLQTEYGQGLQLVGQVARSLGPPPPDKALLDTDPVEYMRQKEAWQEYGQKLGALQQEQQRLMQEWQKGQEAEAQKRRAEMVKQLPELIPEWKDGKRAHKEFAEVCEYLKSRGFSVDELNYADDPRAFAIARDAWIGKQMVERQKSAKPVPVKVEPPGAPKPKTNPSRSQKFLRARETGSVDDAAALIADFL